MGAFYSEYTGSNNNHEYFTLHGAMSRPMAREIFPLPQLEGNAFPFRSRVFASIATNQIVQPAHRPNINTSLGLHDIITL